MIYIEYIYEYYKNNLNLILFVFDFLLNLNKKEK